MRYFLLLGYLSVSITCTYAENMHLPVKNKFSISTGYIGGGENFSDDKEELHGFFVKGAVRASPHIGFYIEYNKQKISILKFNEVTAGTQYKFYSGKKINGLVGGGVGYMWLDQKLGDSNALAADLKLKYITTPLFIEGEARLSEHLSYFSNLSYQWLFNYDSKVCFTIKGIQTTCDSIKVNANGLAYKLGLRYSF